MSLIKNTFRAELILLLLLISFMLPVHAYVDQISSCGEKKTDGSGDGNADAICSSTPPTIYISSGDLYWGSHSAAQSLLKEFTTSVGGVYHILILGTATGRLEMTVPTINDYFGMASLDISARVYEKNGRQIMPPGGQRVSIYPFNPMKIEDFSLGRRIDESFQQDFDVELKPNTRYIVELTAKASTSAKSIGAVISNWGLHCTLPGLSCTSESGGIFWTDCEITPPEPPITDPTCELAYVKDLINQWSNDNAELSTVIDAINHWASSECTASSGVAPGAVEQQKQQLMSMLQNPSQETPVDTNKNEPTLPISKGELTSITWQFGRADGSVISNNMHLEPDGTIGGYSHPNENRWGIEGNELLFYNINGQVSTRFNTFNTENRKWVIQGPFMFPTTFNPYHVLKQLI